MIGRAIVLWREHQQAERWQSPIPEDQPPNIVTASAFLACGASLHFDVRSLEDGRTIAVGTILAQRTRRA